MSSLLVRDRSSRSHEAMKRANLHDMTMEQLVDRFAAITFDQHDAVRRNANAKYNRLFRQMRAVEDELKGRAGDQRRALLPLYGHANAQVRLAAAKATLAVAPEDARQMLRQIADSREFPQAGDAGMCLVALDRGIFKPT
jgi:hypothetical protein